MRKPQLEAAQASITATEAAIAKATADIERTEIKAPFDAIVTARSASVGNLATTQMSLGKLVATERVEIRLPLTTEQVSRLTLPEPGKTAAKELTITLTTLKVPDVSWQAKVVRTEPTVDAQNQVTYVIAEVPKPYDVASRALAVGTFVNAAIPANPIKNTYSIPEAALVNDAFVWALDKDNLLVRIDASRTYSLDGNAYIRMKKNDLTPPLRIVSRPLTNFRQGMEVVPITNVK